MNSRMKDFYDLYVLARDFTFEGNALSLMPDLPVAISKIRDFVFPILIHLAGSEGAVGFSLNWKPNGP